LFKQSQKLSQIVIAWKKKMAKNLEKRSTAPCLLEQPLEIDAYGRQ